VPDPFEIRLRRFAFNISGFRRSLTVIDLNNGQCFLQLFIDFFRRDCFSRRLPGSISNKEEIEPIFFILLKLFNKSSRFNFPFFSFSA